jgi:hypothetical protein
MQNNHPLSSNAQSPEQENKGECKHEVFECNCRVARITAGDNGPVNGYSVDVTVKCIQCGIPFSWVGVPGGYSPAQPMMSLDTYTLRAPIIPSPDPVEHAKILLK